MTRYKSVISRLTIYACFPVLLFSGCSTELDPNDDYKETMVIYSVLNPQDDVHYVKVTKAFLNSNSDAREIAASTPDSSYYAKDDVKVFLEKLTIVGKDTQQVRPGERIELTWIDTTGKAPGGLFSTKRQVLYRTRKKLETKAVYRIVAENRKLETIASGVTEIISPEDFCIDQISRSTSLNRCFYDIKRDTSAFEPQIPGNAVHFFPIPNAQIYSIKFRFNYTESLNGVKESRFVEWPLVSNFVYLEKKDRRIDYDGSTFYENVPKLINSANDDPALVRKAKSVSIILTAGSESLRKNFEASRAYSVFSQIRPEYDNIKNGYGLVASRAYKEVKGVFALTINAKTAETKLITDYPQLKFKL